jgi:PAS domain S-box-containing protein
LLAKTETGGEMKKWSAEKAALSGFVAAVLLLMSLGWLVWQNANQTIEAFRWVTHTHVALTTLGRVESSMFRAEAEQRGYFISGAPAYLNNRDEALRDVSRDTKELAGLLADNSVQTQRLQALTQLIAQRSEIFHFNQKIFEKEGPATVGANFKEGPAVILQVSTAINLMEEEENRLLRQREATEAARLQALNLYFVLLLVIVLLVLGLSLFLMRKANANLRESASRLMTAEEALRTHNAKLEETVRQRSAELQKISEHLRMMVEGIKDYALVMLDPDGRVLTWNIGAENLKGYTADEIIGKHFSIFYSPEEVRLGKPERELRLAQAQGHCEDENWRVRKDGTRFIANVGITALRDEQGKLRGFAKVTRDITERKQNEKILEDYKNHLEGLVHERTAELEQARQQAETANRVKSEFLANMSHELRTPLNAIIGFSEVLKDGLVGDLAATQREYIGDIYDSGQHLLDLINDILDLSKVEAGKMTLELEPLELPVVLNNSLAIVKEKAAAHHIRLTSELAPDLGAMRADPRKLKQILYNLLSNAVKFTDDGGQVTLHVRRVPRAEVGKPSVDWPLRTFPLPPGDFDEFLEISVRDTGTGIPVDGLASLFQPFTQISGGLARQHEGTGLGLVMVKKLAELHGGTVAAASAHGEGSCFFVWLPLRGNEAISPLSPAPRASFAAQAGERIALVVEDDDRAAELIRMQLELEGLKVLRAKTAEAALELAAQQPLALITLDIMLPGMDGWELLARIKQLTELAHVPVVIISIVADNNKGFSLGAAAVLQKPISRDDLHGVLRSLGLVATLRGARPTLLVVDDDPKAVEIIVAHLPPADYNVICAYGGHEAIELAHRLLPDLILLDLLMPEVSGFEVAEDLMGHPDTANIPVVIVTSKTVTAEDRAMLNGCVVQIVNKAEFAQEHFIGQVRRALAHRRKET